MTLEDDFRRPDHPDFMTSSEFAGIHFTGVRHNSITDYMELWLVGEKKFELRTLDYKFNPEKWAKGYEEVFALHHVEVLKEKGN